MGMDSQELLALEDRIGNVSTGLSEETIMKHLKLQKYKSSSQYVENEPCCICQVRCSLLIISCLFYNSIILITGWSVISSGRICRRG